MAQVNPGPIQQKPTTDPSYTLRDTPQNIAAGVARGGQSIPRQTPAQQINNAMQNASAQQQQPVSAQTQANAQTTQQATGSVYFVGGNGNGPKGMKAGDQVVTGGGTYTIAAVNPDGSYQTQLTNPNQNTSNYTGAYANHTGRIYQVDANTNSAPKGLQVGDQVVTGGGTYTINAVAPDGSYSSILSNRGQTTANFTGQYSAAPGAAPAAVQPQQPQQPSFAQGYNPNLDYTTEIEKARQANDPIAAAALEILRNQKIDATGTGNQYAKTNVFEQFYSQVTPDDLFRLQNGYTPNTSIRTQNPYPGMEELNQQMYENQQQQAANRINYTTEQAVREQNRIYEDALPEFQKQRNQVDIDEARAKSNSALYAEARGDRGGIGQSQYNEIQAAAMQNRQAINTAQQKLATDIARKVADLRAQGEYQLSDAMLELGNQYLSRLMDLKAQGAEFALNIEQMNRELANQDRQFKLQVAGITGEYDGQPTYAAQKYEQERYAAWVEAMAKAGMEISPELLKAAGLDNISGDISKYANLMAALSFSSGGSGGGGGSGRGSGGGGGGNGSGTDDTGTTPTGGNNNTAYRFNAEGSISRQVNAINNNSSLSPSQKTERKKKLIGTLDGWVSDKKISEAEAGRIIAQFDLTGEQAKAKESNTQNKRKVDKEGRGFE